MVRGLGRVLRRGTTVAVALAAVSVVVASVGTVADWWRIQPVLSGSMEPTIGTGALVLARPIDPAAIEVGDVVVFRSPRPWSSVTMHRVAQLGRVRDTPIMRTQGDANAAMDPWHLDLTSARAWRVVGHVPAIGYLLLWLQEPVLRIALLVAGVVVLAAIALQHIWAPRRPEAATVAVRRAFRPRVRRVAGVAVVGALLASSPGARAGFGREAATSLPVTSATVGAPAALSCRWTAATTVGLTWSAAAGAAGYVVERDDGGGFVAVATLPDGSTTTADDTVALGAPRTYRVAATRAAWTGDPSPTATTPSCAAAIATFAGRGLDAGYDGDGGPATAARLDRPLGLAVAPDGTVFLADQSSGTSVIRAVSPDGTITTVAGGGDQTTCSFAGAATGPGGLALGEVWGLVHAPAPSTVLYLTDQDANCVRAFDTTTGTVAPLAGGGADASCGYFGPGAGVALSDPHGLDVDGAGNVYVADPGNRCVRRLSPAGEVSVVAGTGNPAPAPLACSAVGTSTTTDLGQVVAVAADDASVVYLADATNGCIRRVGALGALGGVAGGGATGACSATGAPGDVALPSPSGLAVDAAGTVLYVADYASRCVVRFGSTAGAFTTTERVAGDGTAVSAPWAATSGDGGWAPAARLGGPTAVALTATGDLLVSDYDAATVRRAVTP